MKHQLRLRHLWILLLLLASASSLAQESIDKPTVSEDKPLLGEEESSLSQSPNLHQWGAVTLFHGLPSDHVRAIAQTADGVLWFGTDGGLAKYDGRRTQKTTAEELPEGRVRALKTDGKGCLWIGTDAGAARMVGDKFIAIKETLGQTITAITIPEQNRAFLASDKGTIFTCKTESDGSLAVDSIGPQNSLLLADLKTKEPIPITSLALVKERILIGTYGRGLLALDGRGVTELFAGGRARPFFVEAIEVGSRGQVWFGSKTAAATSGLHQSDDLRKIQKFGESTGWVTSLCSNVRGELWTGTSERGAFLYRDSQQIEHFTFENSAGGLRSNRVYSVFVDREGVVWFGTDRGVCRYDPHSPHAERVSFNPDGNFARSIYQSSDGRVWCGSNKGLFSRDPKNGVWKPVDELKGKSIHSIAEDSSGLLLVGSAGGLYSGAINIPELPGVSRFSRIGNSEASAGYSDSVRAICKFQGAAYIASFGRGVEKLEGAARVLVWPVNPSNPQEREVLSLYSDKDERLWIGTASEGVFVFDGKQTTAERSLDELRGGAVRDFDGTLDGGLWVAGDKGLYLYKSGTLSRIVEGSARAVASGSSPNSIWCGMVDLGLYKIAIDELAGQITTRLDTEHGLPSDSVFAIFPSRSAFGDEVLWIGTNRGAAYYEPGSVAPIVKATRVLGKRPYQPEEVQKGLVLEYPQNSLVLEVAAASSRTFPEQFQYSFVLLNEKGRVIKSPKISRDSQFLMENLRPGRYRVEARAYANDLAVSDPLVFGFDVAAAPFPFTTGALSILLALALFALWWGYRQNRRIAGTNIALGEANRQLAETRIQLASETENERKRIARDLHDQTLSDLRRLLLLTDQLPVGKDSYSGDSINPVFFRGELESISTEIRRICEDLSPSALTNIGLMAAFEWALSDAAAHMPVKKRFEYEFVYGDDIEERLQFSSTVQIQLYRIVREAVSNICHHAEAVHVKLTAEIDDGQLIIELEDDGRSFDMKNPTKTGRGLSNMKSRASMIEAEASWSERPDGGTIFTLRKKI